MSQGTRQSERAAAEAKAGTTDSGRMPGLGVRPRICSTSGPAWEQEARKAAGAWREALECARAFKRRRIQNDHVRIQNDRHVFRISIDYILELLAHFACSPIILLLYLK